MTARTAPLSARVLPEPTGHVPPWPGRQEGPVFVRRGPAGEEPALLVHGLGGSSTNWTDLIALLEGVLECEALDLPGFGHSPPPARGYALRTHVQAVVDRIEARGAGAVHLMGNSLGGAVAVQVAAARPDLVRTLTLVSPALPTLLPPRGADPRLPLLVLPGVRRLATRRMAALTPQQRARAVLDLCFGDPSRISPERYREAADEVARRGALGYDTDAFNGSLRGLAATYAHRGPRAVWRQVRRVQAPSLVVWGVRDRLVPVRLAARTAEALPDGRLLVLSGVGHVAQMERPDLVARAVLPLILGEAEGHEQHDTRADLQTSPRADVHEPPDSGGTLAQPAPHPGPGRHTGG